MRKTIHILPCRRAFSDILKDTTPKSFSGGKPRDTQFPLTPFVCFHTYSLPTTLFPFKMMLVKAVQSTFYTTCTLALNFHEIFTPLPKIWKFPLLDLRKSDMSLFRQKWTAFDRLVQMLILVPFEIWQVNARLLTDFLPIFIHNFTAISGDFTSTNWCK